MNLKTSLLDRISFYRTIQDRAGVSLRCLDPDADETLTAAVEAGDNGAVTVRVQGPLDDWFGFDVRALIAELDEASPDSIHLLIESPGGFLDDGLALYSDLRARARDGATVTAEARGVVASAAVLPFLAADRRAMSTGTQMLIHEPWLFFAAIGTADEIEDGAEKAINGLRAGEKTLHQVMVERTGNSRQKIGALLKAETWFDPNEAVESGFATAAIEDIPTAPEDAQAKALARRLMTQFRLNLTKENDYVRAD